MVGEAGWHCGVPRARPPRTRSLAFTGGGGGGTSVWEQISDSTVTVEAMRSQMKLREMIFTPKIQICLVASSYFRLAGPVSVYVCQ